jgi:hypothetical protein
MISLARHQVAQARQVSIRLGLTLPVPGGFLDDPPLDANAALGLERSVQNVRVEIDPARPLDRAALRIHPNLFEDLAIRVDRVESPAACERAQESAQRGERSADQLAVNRLIIVT